MNNPESSPSQNSEFKYPHLENLREFVHQETLHDKYVSKSIEEGYMTEEELLVARWITKLLDTLSDKEGIDDHEIWKSNVPVAAEAAATLFNISVDEAKILFEKSLSIRSRHMKLDEE